MVAISRGYLFLAVFFRVTYDRLSKRGTTCNLKRVLLLNLIFLLLAVSQTLCTGVSGEERYFPVFSSTEVRWRKAGYKHDELLVNPLTPVPPVNGCDEHWPLFHFWRHHIWKIKFWGRKRSFPVVPRSEHSVPELNKRFCTVMDLPT